MSLEIPELDTKGLRQFGLILAAILVVVFGLFLPWTWELTNLPNWYWIIIAALVALWAMFAPDSMHGFYYVWMKVAMTIGNVVNAVILAIVFFGVITPMGIVMRMVGKDPMRRTLNSEVISYRIVSLKPKRNDMERPF